MPKNKIRQAAEALFRSLRECFMPRPAVVAQGQDPRWREHQAERGERERALYQLRMLGWPSA